MTNLLHLGLMEATTNKLREDMKIFKVLNVQINKFIMEVKVVRILIVNTLDLDFEIDNTKV